MKKTAALFLALCMVFALSACGGQTGGTPAAAKEEAPFTLNVCVSAEPITIDPTMVATTECVAYVSHLFENLMCYTAADEPFGEDPRVAAAELDYGAAESFAVSDDGLVYTFTLRDGALWSDGKPLTAGDFVYSWRRLCDPGMASDYGYILSGIVKGAAEVNEKGAPPETLGVKALDDRTLEITLEAPCPFFLQLCAFPNLVPLREDVIGQYGDSWTEPANMVCNGPYRMNEWVHDSLITMVPNENYRDPSAIGPREIRWHLTDDEEAILSSYQSGEYDFTDSLRSNRAAALRESGECRVLPSVSTYFLFLNGDHLTDWRVRAAIALCIDRDDLVANVTGNGQIPAASLVAGGVTDSTGAFWKNGTGGKEVLWAGLAALYPEADLSTYDGRCELARTLLEAAVADGFDPSAPIPYRVHDGFHAEIAEVVRKNAASVLGLNMTLQNADWETYTSVLVEDPSWSIARFGWQADYLDASTFLDLMVTGGVYNFGGWSDPAYDELAARYKTMPGGAERDQVMYDAEALLFGEGGFTVCPLYYYTTPYCLSRNVDRVTASPIGFFLFTYARPAE